MKLLIISVWLAAAAIAVNAARPPQIHQGPQRLRAAQDGASICTNEKDAPHKCECAKATTSVEDCPTDGHMDMSHCTNYCYEDQCRCVTVCDFNAPEAQPK